MSRPIITPQDFVFLGDSHIEYGGDWAARLGNPHIRNCGVAGDDADDVYHRLRPVAEGHPCRLLLAVGINDISHGLTTEEISQRIRRIIDALHRESPQTKLYLQSLLPINESFGLWTSLTGKTEQVPQLNSRLRLMAREEQAAYIDVFDAFCEEDTHTLRAALSVDGLHLNAKGYALWEQLLRPYVV
jgi:lysophospholipase L1-like esterase